MNAEAAAPVQSSVRPLRSRRATSPDEKPAPLRPPVAIPTISPLLFSLFNVYVRRYLARHMHAVRIARNGIPTAVAGPVLLVLNHPSWWDPLICQLLLQSFPDRQHYGPIDAAALRKYPFFKRLGYFGVEQDSLRGAGNFLRIGSAVLADPKNVLWVTAQGNFTDPRTRPANLRPGVGHLAHRMTEGVVLPLALEYPFWEERTPEVLIRFGTPLSIADGNHRSAREWTTAIERALESTQDALAEDARRRSADAFTIHLSGKAGVGGIYDWWRAIREGLRGRRFRAEHGMIRDRAGVG